MTRSGIITGKIVAIITARGVLINRGDEDEVKVGMKFAVYLSLGPFADPDNPDVKFASLLFPKGTLTVSTVFGKMSYCSIGPRFDPNTSTTLLGGGVSAIYPPVEKPLISDDAWVIKVGDEVHQIVESSKSSL